MVIASGAGRPVVVPHEMGDEVWGVAEKVDDGSLRLLANMVMSLRS